MKKMNQKGFTMAELLIVVAIIAIMVAIAIPVFTSTVEKAKVGTGLANARAAYAEAVTAEIAKGTTSNISVTIDPDLPDNTQMNVNNTAHTITITCNNVSDSFNFDDDVTVNDSAAATTYTLSTTITDDTTLTAALANDNVYTAVFASAASDSYSSFTQYYTKNGDAYTETDVADANDFDTNKADLYKATTAPTKVASGANYSNSNTYYIKS